MLQNFQQQPVKPEINTQPPVHAIHTHTQNVTAGLGMVPPQPPLPTQPGQQKTAFDKVAVHFCICDQQLNVVITAEVKHCLGIVYKLCSMVLRVCYSKGGNFQLHKLHILKTSIMACFFNYFPRNCLTVLTTMMNQKLEKKQRRMKCRHSPPCKPLICYIV